MSVKLLRKPWFFDLRNHFTEVKNCFGICHTSIPYPCNHSEIVALCSHVFSPISYFLLFETCESAVVSYGLCEVVTKHDVRRSREE